MDVTRASEKMRENARLTAPTDDENQQDTGGEAVAETPGWGSIGFPVVGNVRVETFAAGTVGFVAGYLWLTRDDYAEHPRLR